MANLLKQSLHIAPLLISNHKAPEVSIQVAIIHRRQWPSITDHDFAWEDGTEGAWIKKTCLVQWGQKCPTLTREYFSYTFCLLKMFKICLWHQCNMLPRVQFMTRYCFQVKAWRRVEYLGHNELTSYYIPFFIMYKVICLWILVVTVSTSWLSTYTRDVIWGKTIHPYINVKTVLTKPPLKIRYRYITTSNTSMQRLFSSLVGFS